MAIKNLVTSGTASEIVESSATIIDAFKGVLDSALVANPTKEQVAFMAIGVGGIVALYAIRNKFSFTCDLQAKKISFEAPREAQHS